MKPNAPHRLIVEGKDDMHSIIHLTKRHGLDWDLPTAGMPFVHDAGGVEEALDSIATSAKSFARVGVVLDADSAPTGRWQALRDRFAGGGVTLPSQPDPAGTVLRLGGRPDRVGVWLMPGNNQSGKLEDFIATLVPVTDVCWDHAKRSAADAKGLGASFTDPDLIKAQVHTWLAWQQEPGRALGTAITSCYFAHDSPEALGFVAWFRRLFID